VPKSPVPQELSQLCGSQSNRAFPLRPSRWRAPQSHRPLHYRFSYQHMPYYLDEFTFRFNRRNSRARGMLFYRLLQQAVDTDPHPLKDLIGG